MPTATCPGCGRVVYLLEQDNGVTVNCAKCDAPIMATWEPTPPLYDEFQSPAASRTPLIVGVSLAAGAIVAVAGLCACGGILSHMKEKPEGSAEGRKSSKPAAKEEPVSYRQCTVSQVLNEYKNNAIRADSMLKGQRIEVTGTVLSVDTTIFGSPFVVIGQSGQSFGFGVQCVFKKAGALGSLNKGDVVTIRGVCKGQVLNVQVDDCELIR